MNKETRIVKASGNVESFSIEKLKTSLRRSGADEATIEEIAKNVADRLYDGITTRKIYQMAFKMLNRHQNKPAAAKYSIKRAIMELGPSGFPFEKYVSLVLEQLDFKVRIDQIIQGACVNHEVDIIAENADSIRLMECKYHNLPGIVCDIKVPLYVNSRFRDITGNVAPGTKKYECWIVTNTKFSKDALQYGNCAGQHLLGWDYPEKNGLKELVDRHRLYPVSCLTSLTKKEKQLLLEKGVILCKELVQNPNILSDYNIGVTRVTNIIGEALSLSKT